MFDTITADQQPQLASSVDTAAKRTDLDASYLRNEIRDGNLRAVRRGKRVLILEEDLQIYLRGEEVDKAAIAA